jgi:hypothetical protein
MSVKRRPDRAAGRINPDVVLQAFSHLQSEGSLGSTLPGQSDLVLGFENLQARRQWLRIERPTGGHKKPYKGRNPFSFHKEHLIFLV